MGPRDRGPKCQSFPLGQTSEHGGCQLVCPCRVASGYATLALLMNRFCYWVPPIWLHSFGNWWYSLLCKQLLWSCVNKPLGKNFNHMIPNNQEPRCSPTLNRPSIRWGVSCSDWCSQLCWSMLSSAWGWSQQSLVRFWQRVSGKRKVQQIQSVSSTSENAPCPDLFHHFPASTALFQPLGQLPFH